MVLSELATSRYWRCMTCEPSCLAPKVLSAVKPSNAVSEEFVELWCHTWDEIKLRTYLSKNDGYFEIPWDTSDGLLPVLRFRVSKKYAKKYESDTNWFVPKNTPIEVLKEGE